jgi:hypothetical protein
MVAIGDSGGEAMAQLVSMAQLSPFDRLWIAIKSPIDRYCHNWHHWLYCRHWHHGLMVAIIAIGILIAIVNIYDPLMTADLYYYQ